MKRETPYERLLRIARRFSWQVSNPIKKFGWRISKEDLENRKCYRLDDTAIEVKLADKLGYDTQLVWEEEGLRIVFVKRPEIPGTFQT